MVAAAIAATVMAGSSDPDGWGPGSVSPGWDAVSATVVSAAEPRGKRWLDVTMQFEPLGKRWAAVTTVEPRGKRWAFSGSATRPPSWRDA